MTLDINNYYATKISSPIILAAIQSNCKTGLSKEGKRAGGVVASFYTVLKDTCNKERPIFLSGYSA